MGTEFTILLQRRSTSAGFSQSQRNTGGHLVEAARYRTCASRTAATVDFLTALFSRGKSFLAELDNTDRIDGPVRRRKRQSAVRHQFSQEGGRLRTRNGGLYARSNKTIGIIDGLPGVAGVDGHDGTGLAAASVPRFQLGAVIDQELNHCISTLQCRAPQARSAV